MVVLVFSCEWQQLSRCVFCRAWIVVEVIRMNVDVNFGVPTIVHVMLYIKLMWLADVVVVV
jgi:hypothetical protein